MFPKSTLQVPSFHINKHSIGEQSPLLLQLIGKKTSGEQAKSAVPAFSVPNLLQSHYIASTSPMKRRELEFFSYVGVPNNVCV